MPHPTPTRQQEPTPPNSHNPNNHSQLAHLTTTANHQATINPHQQQTNHHNMALNGNITATHPNSTNHPNPDTHNPHNIPQLINQEPGPSLDNYINPWGDHLEQPIPLDTVQICLQNFGRWPKNSKTKKMTIFSSLSTLQKLISS